jgi:hypothetical protein
VDGEHKLIQSPVIEVSDVLGQFYFELFVFVLHVLQQRRQDLDLEVLLEVCVVQVLLLE